MERGKPLDSEWDPFRLMTSVVVNRLYAKIEVSEKRRGVMGDQNIKSKHYQELTQMFPDVMSAVENLGKTVRSSGPLDEKNIHLIQLAAAAASRSEGAVHSHTRRAVQAGVAKEEIYHALLLLVSTIGFPNVAAAISWSQDVLNDEA